MKLRGVIAVGLSIVLGTLVLSILGWLSITGQLTIFGDTDAVTNFDVSLLDQAEPAAVHTASDRRLTVSDEGLSLVAGASRGTMIFTVGQRELASLHRFVAWFAVPPSAGSQVTARFAGSRDGVSFSPPSPAQAIVPDESGSQTSVPIELGFLIPASSRFSQIELTLERAATGPSPVLGRLVVNVSQGAAGDPTDPENSVVRVSSESTNAVGPTPAGRPAELVVTGSPVQSTAVVLGVSGLVWLSWTIVRVTRARGAHGRSDTAP